ncbi:MAG TPA: tetratricopeptide repeat protein [bacterium]|jgi:tetratricopeptide (TPR) repeat protein|nr:tetratricopeptide repeat protein [bacterium]
MKVLKIIFAFSLLLLVLSFDVYWVLPKTIPQISLDKQSRSLSADREHFAVPNKSLVIGNRELDLWIGKYLLLIIGNLILGLFLISVFTGFKNTKILLEVTGVPEDWIKRGFSKRGIAQLICDEILKLYSIDETPKILIDLEEGQPDYLMPEGQESVEIDLKYLRFSKQWLTQWFYEEILEKYQKKVRVQILQNDNNYFAHLTVEIDGNSSGFSLEGRKDDDELIKNISDTLFKLLHPIHWRMFKCSAGEIGFEALETYILETTTKKEFNTFFNLAKMAMKYKVESEKVNFYFVKADETTKIKKEKSNLYFSWGLYFDSLKEREHAIEKYEKSIKFNKNNIKAYNNCGVNYNRLKRYSEAFEIFEKLLAIKQDYAKGYFNAAASLKGLGKPAEALKMYEKATLIKPDYYLAFSQWGLFLLKKDDFSGAIFKFKKLISLMPNDFKAYLNWGYCLEKKGEIDEALQKYTMSININPKYIMGYENLGKLYQKTGENIKAQAMFDKANELKIEKE